MTRFLGHVLIVLALTVLTQVGGLAWICALVFRRRLIAFLALYLGLSAASLVIAPQVGRVAATCWRGDQLQVQSWSYCLMNRTYMTPELLKTLEETANEVAMRQPGTVTLLLDAGFPFGHGFPLLPHLSHHDGRKADLAFYYRTEAGYLPGLTRSPVGYFAFERGPTDCPTVWPTLRWDLDTLQPLFRDAALEPERTRLLVTTLVDDPRLGRIFLEPHLMCRLGLYSSKLRFQGCRAARHDDHLHVELR